MGAKKQLEGYWDSISLPRMRLVAAADFAGDKQTISDKPEQDAKWAELLPPLFADDA